MKNDPQTTPRENLALGLAVAFVRLSNTPFYACIDDETLTKEDLANILEGLKEKLCPTKQ